VSLPFVERGACTSAAFSAPCFLFSVLYHCVSSSEQCSASCLRVFILGTIKAMLPELGGWMTCNGDVDFAREPFPPFSSFDIHLLYFSSHLVFFVYSARKIREVER
jgi:hypothetical protein